MQKHYHLIGIGGIGMSALARILLQKGEKVSGSDLVDSSTTKQLKGMGADVTIGHSEKNVGKPFAVVYSTDIPEDNPELLFAKKRNIPLIHRARLLAQLLEGHTPILVTGTHGKTTTASLLAHVLQESGSDPSYALGGYLNGLDSNGHYGKGIYFVVEADESDGSFLYLPSFGAIITNLEHDHMYYWKTEEALLKAFKEFAGNVGSNRHFFWCYDDLLLRSLKLPGISFGFSEKADLYIENFFQNQWSMHFDLFFQGRQFQNLEIPLIGAHNVLNAAAAFGMGLQLDASEESLRSTLKSFRGVGRRAEKKGAVAEIEVYDDYAHHPTEIFATLRALKLALHGKRLIVAFQPHRYSRTKYCLDDFAESFRYADEVILTDIYAAREPPLAEVTPEKVIERIKGGGYNTIQFVPRDQLIDHLKSHLKAGDVLVTMGAGDITGVGPALLKQLKP